MAIQSYSRAKLVRLGYTTGAGHFSRGVRVITSTISTLPMSVIGLVAEVRERGSLYEGRTGSYQFDGGNELGQNRRRHVPAEWMQSRIAP